MKDGSKLSFAPRDAGGFELRPSVTRGSNAVLLAVELVSRPGFVPRLGPRTA